MTKSLIVIGATYLDIILSVPHFPGEDEKLRATQITQRCGGNGPNTLECLQQLIEHHGIPLRLFLCSVLPAESSQDIQTIRESLSERVDLSTCISRPDHTKAASSYIIRSSATGSRTIVNFNALPEMTREEFVQAMERVDDNVALFHFEGRIPEVSLECITWVRTTFPHAMISVELEKPGREGLAAMAAEADIVFHSKTWAQHEGHQSAEDCLIAQQSVTKRAKLLFCTWGDRGAHGLETETGRVEHCPAIMPKGSKVVDSVGAGDCFNAGILYCLLENKARTLADMLRFAVRLAGAKVAQEGFTDLVERAQQIQ